LPEFVLFNADPFGYLPLVLFEDRRGCNVLVLTHFFGALLANEKLSVTFFLLGGHVMTKVFKIAQVFTELANYLSIGGAPFVKLRQQLILPNVGLNLISIWVALFLGLLDGK